MHRTTSGDPYADGSNLARASAVRIDPDAVVMSEPTGLGAEVSQDVDEQLLDSLHVRCGVGHTAAPLSGHGQDRVADELTRAVVGDVTTSVGGRNSGTHRLDVNEQVLTRGPLRQRHDMVMLEQE